MTNQTFAPDERPYEPVHDAAPFTPEQETRLRAIAWDAASTYAIYDATRRGGRPADAELLKVCFLEGTGA